MIKNQLVSTRLLLSFGLIMSAQFASAVKLSIDNSSPLGLSNSSNYTISNQIIEFNTSDPVICRNLQAPAGGFRAEIIDPNGDGQLMPLQQSIGYNISSQTINAKINNPSGVCVTKNGSTYGDLIFRDQFSLAALRYEGMNDQVVRGQSLDYTIRIENIDPTVMRYDLIEFVSSNSVTHAAYFGSVDTWSCNNHNNGGVICNEDQDLNKLYNASIPSGGFAEIDVSRTVGSTSVVGQSVDIVTAVFMKNGQGQIVDVQVISHTPTVVDNQAPVVSWVDGSGLNFTEDDNQTQGLSFNVVDVTGANLDVAYLATAIGAINDKLIIDNISVIEGLPGNYVVSFDVMPKANQFTSTGNNEQIFVQIEDIFNAQSNTLTLPVTIAPINDAPSFTPTCLDFTINPTPLSGETEITCNVSNGVNRANWSYSNFINLISAGGVGNDTEANQTVIFEVDPISGLALQNPITIGADPSTFIQDDLYLLLDDGITGQGSFRIRALDNGTPGGSLNDVCPAVSVNDHCSVSEYSQEIVFNIEAPNYYISGTINDLTSGEEVTLRLFVPNTNTPIGGSELITGDGNSNIDLNMSAALIDGQDYELRITLQPLNSTCAITVGDTGTINGANEDNVVIECGP